MNPMNIVVKQHYLNLAVRNGGEMRLVDIYDQGRRVRQFQIELAGSQAPDYWSFLDVSPWMDRELTIVVTPPLDDPAALTASLRQSDGLLGAEDLYREALRPQFHFSSKRGWINDPNGLAYYQGQYHMFYQHNPFGTHWGNMHWGHAVSTDLVHWMELPEALYQDGSGMMFSGSGVVDHLNTTGFGQGGEPPLVVMFTAAGGQTPWSQEQPFTQGLAYSPDGGKTLVPYSGNPVLGHIQGGNRDPKVIWHAPTNRWVMALYLDPGYGLFASSDLKQWEKLCDYDIPECTECPDIFELPLVCNPLEPRWILYGANNCYLIGRFDGKQFIQEEAVTHMTAHANNYAAQTYDNAPDGRRIQIGWLRFLDDISMPFSQQMTFPVELSLRTTADGIRLCAEPVRELDLLRRGRQSWLGVRLEPGQSLQVDSGTAPVEIRVELRPAGGVRWGMKIRGVALEYDAARQELTCAERTAHLALQDGKLTLQLLVDRISLEIFANHGSLSMPLGIVFPAGEALLEVYAQGGTVELDQLEVVELASIWQLAR